MIGTEPIARINSRRIDLDCEIAASLTPVDVASLAPEVYVPVTAKKSLIGRSADLVTSKAIGAVVAATLFGLGLFPKGVAHATGAQRSEQTVTCPLDEPPPDPRIESAARNPLGETAISLAKEALAAGTAVRADHPYLVYKAALHDRMARLGLLRPSPDHVHIADVDLEHGGAVTRSALGLQPLVTKVTSTMSVGHTTARFAEMVLRPEQVERFAGLLHADGIPPPDTDQPQPSLAEMTPSLKELLANALDDLELSVLEKVLILHQLRYEVANRSDATRVFVNMSFGQSPDRIASDLAMMIMTAPPGTELYRLAVRTLGEPPVRLPELADEDPAACTDPNQPEEPVDAGPPPPELVKMMEQAQVIKAKLVYPRLKSAIAAPDFQRRMKIARGDLQTEVARGRSVGIMLFEAAGNEFSDARAAGDPNMSRSTSAGIRGIIRVGASQIVSPLERHKDRMAEFSAVGPTTVTAPGAAIPVWLSAGKTTDADGTSFASPIQLEAGLAVAALLPDASIDDIERIITDRRAALDVRRTNRDGAGVSDPFAAAVIALNPKATRAAIERAWNELANPNADISAIKKRLALPQQKS